MGYKKMMIIEFVVGAIGSAILWHETSWLATIGVCALLAANNIKHSRHLCIMADILLEKEQP